MAVASVVLVSPASMSPSSADSTLVLRWDSTSALFKAPGFVGVTPPSYREQRQTQAGPGGMVQAWTRDSGASVLGLGWNSGNGGVFFLRELNPGGVDAAFCLRSLFSPCGKTC